MQINNQVELNVYNMSQNKNKFVSLLFKRTVVENRKNEKNNHLLPKGFQETSNKSRLEVTRESSRRSFKQHFSSLFCQL